MSACVKIINVNLYFLFLCLCVVTSPRKVRRLRLKNSWLKLPYSTVVTKTSYLRFNRETGLQAKKPPFPLSFCWSQYRREMFVAMTLPNVPCVDSILTWISKDVWPKLTDCERCSNQTRNRLRISKIRRCFFALDDKPNTNTRRPPINKI